MYECVDIALVQVIVTPRLAMHHTCSDVYMSTCCHSVFSLLSPTHRSNIQIMLVKESKPPALQQHANNSQ